MNIRLPFFRKSLSALCAAGIVLGALAPDASAQRRHRTPSVNVGAEIRFGGGEFRVGFGDHYGRRRARRVVNRCGYESPRRTWVPGRWEYETRRVWVEGTSRRVWVEAIRETRYDECGRAYTVVIRPGRYETVCEPGYYDTRRVRVWRPGNWRVFRG